MCNHGNGDLMSMAPYCAPLGMTHNSEFTDCNVVRMLMIWLLLQFEEGLEAMLHSAGQLYSRCCLARASVCVYVCAEAICEL